jgi:hypothetical protein
MTLHRKLDRLESRAQDIEEPGALNPEKVTHALLAFTAWGYLLDEEAQRLRAAQPKLTERKARELSCARVPPVDELLTYPAAELCAVVGVASTAQFQAQFHHALAADPDYPTCLQRAHERALARMTPTERLRLTREARLQLRAFAGS